VTDEPEKISDYSEPSVDKSADPFQWDLDAKGQLTVHLIPKVIFGIVFDNSAISNAALDLGVYAYTWLYADLKVGGNQPLVYSTCHWSYFCLCLIWSVCVAYL
jgi:chitinase